MRISKAQNEAVVSNNQTENKMEFTLTKNSSKLFFMLRDGFYAYKIQTMVQEYMSNARDSHRAAGIPETPIKVILPTKSNPSLIIKDVGTGMGLKELKVFSSYLDSSKDSDDTQTGGFGIGGKIGFAYTDSFVIVSRKDGKEYTVFANKSESENGAMNISSPTNTSLPNGVDVIIPIQEKDFADIYRAVQRCGMFWDIRPEIMNDKILQKELSVLSSSVEFKGQSWKVMTFKNMEEMNSFATIHSGNEEARNPFLITVDGIIYPITDKILSTVKEKVKGKIETLFPLLFKEEIKKSKSSWNRNDDDDEGDEDDEDKNAGNLHKIGTTVLHFKTNEITVVGNREAITDSEHNINSIANKLILVNDEFKKTLYNRIEKELSPRSSIRFIYDFSKKFDLPSYKLVQKYKNKEDIVVTDDGFGIPKIVERYGVDLFRRGATTVNDVNICLVPFSNFSKVEKIGSVGFNREIVYLQMAKSMVGGALKRKLAAMPEFSTKNYIYAYHVDQDDVVKLNNLGFINKDNFFTVKMAEGKRSSAGLDENNIRCFKINNLRSTDDYWNRVIHSKEDITVNIATLRKGVVFLSKEFKSISDSFSKGDLEWISENKLDFYIVTSKQMEKLKGLIQFDDIHRLLTKCSKSNLYFQGEDSESIVSDMLVVFYKKMNTQSKGRFKPFCFTGKPNKKQIGRTTRLKMLDEAFRKKFRPEFEEFKKFEKTVLKKNPFLHVVKSISEIENTSSKKYKPAEVLKNLEKIIKF